MRPITTLLTILFISLLSSPSWSDTLTMDDLTERNGVYYKKFTSVPFSGLVVQDCPKGKPKDIFQEGFSGKIVNGLREDYWIITSCFTSSIQRGNFLRGQKHGTWEFYYKDGQLERVGPFRNNRPHGNWTWYDKWGRLLIKDKYEDGEIVFWTSYDENEQVEKMGPYKNGEPVGTWKFFKNGQLDKTIEYK